MRFKWFGTNGWEILPTHWDNFEKPFTEPAQDLRAVFGDPGNLDLRVKEAKRVSPKSKVVVLKFFESYAPWAVLSHSGQTWPRARASGPAGSCGGKARPEEDAGCSGLPSSPPRAVRSFRTMNAPRPPARAVPCSSSTTP